MTSVTSRCEQNIVDRFRNFSKLFILFSRFFFKCQCKLFKPLIFSYHLLPYFSCTTSFSLNPHHVCKQILTLMTYEMIHFYKESAVKVLPKIVWIYQVQNSNTCHFDTNTLHSFILKTCFKNKHMVCNFQVSFREIEII